MVNHTKVGNSYLFVGFSPLIYRDFVGFIRLTHPSINPPTRLDNKAFSRFQQADLRARFRKCQNEFVDNKTITDDGKIYPYPQKW